MVLTDTHAHLYLDDFNDDRRDMILRAIHAGVQYMFLPNIDSASIPALMKLAGEFPDNCFPMMGLHPTSVGPDYGQQLSMVQEWLDKGGFCAVGEIGLDLYWDRTYIREQEVAFRQQVRLAKKHNLPIVIHTRNSMTETLGILEDEGLEGLKGVFHCFSGNAEQARLVTRHGFYLGVGGVLTYKNSPLPAIVEQTGLEHILLETDAPFLTPVPHRGKRNESAYISIINDRVAGIKSVTAAHSARITTENALKLFLPSAHARHDDGAG